MCNATEVVGEKIKRHLSTRHRVDKQKDLSMSHLVEEQKKEDEEVDKVEKGRRRVVSEKEAGGGKEASNVDLTKGAGCLRTSTSLIKVTGMSKRGQYQSI